jgi:hypothetical protein
LKKRARNNRVGLLISLIDELHRTSMIEVGISKVVPKIELPQESVLTPLQSIMNHELGLKKTYMLEQVRSRGDLLVFADDTLLISNSKVEEEDIIIEFAALEIFYNFRLNKKKSEILTPEDLKEIERLKCRKTVMYLGVRITTDRSEQRGLAKE